MFHPEDQDLAWARWRESLETGEPYEIEYRLRHHSGEYRWTLGRALPVRDESGTIIRWIGTCTDIHEAKRTAELNDPAQPRAQPSHQEHLRGRLRADRAVGAAVSRSQGLCRAVAGPGGGAGARA